MAGKETRHKHTNEQQQKVRKIFHEQIEQYAKAGTVIHIPENHEFRDFVNVVHQEDAAYNHGTPEYEAIGKLKYNIIATILGESLYEESGDTSGSKQVFPSPTPKLGTAEHFFRNVLGVFRPDPWRIPFSVVNFLAHRVNGEGFTPVRELLRGEGTDGIVGEEAQKSKRFTALWGAYANNRALGIDKTKYYESYPPISQKAKIAKVG